MVSLGNSNPEKSRYGLHWLIRMRWLAAGGQTVACLVAAGLLHYSLPLVWLAACILITLLTNTYASLFLSKGQNRTEWISAGLLVLDTLVLTVMLWLTGGAHNPFTAFYVLHITIAAILLPTLWTWLGVVLCTGCYSILFASPYALKTCHGLDLGSFDAHLQGMLIAMVLSGGCIALFVSQLSRDLSRQEQELAEARLQTARNERFAALATLAAGVAHELATPLGTIAVVSSDLEKLACDVCHSGECKTDARLIRGEIERCRAILEKLSDRTTHGLGDPVEPVDLQRIPSLLSPYLKSEYVGRLKYEIAQESTIIPLPQAALLQSLAVLIKNAFEASATHQSVWLNIQEEDGGIRMSVRDEGNGMTPEIAARVGDPFFTTKEPGRGMGLGLFLVRTFIERVHGKLDIQSEPGRGTTIQLYIPRQQESAE